MSLKLGMSHYGKKVWAKMFEKRMMEKTCVSKVEKETGEWR
jgi:hypothetical protein